MQGEAARQNMPGLDFGRTWRTVDGDYPELIGVNAPEAAPAPPETGPIVGASDAPAQDLDGDGVYEDLNGDGTFNVIDVSVLFDNFRSNVVQTNAELFDVNGDGSVNVIDVSELLSQA
jgi:hypothetical protein